jgi:uncharacterized protein YecE (DUF72 family)
MNKPTRLRVGIAGWSIPSANRQEFGDGASMLERYASRFSCVEVNSSFYRRHQRKTYERWASVVPSGFRFSVKAPRTITHEHALRAVGTLLDDFIAECSGLGRKLGVVLVQLPGSVAFDARVASNFFSMLGRRLPKAVHVVCEPRHASWLSPAATRLLERHSVNRAGADPSPILDDAAPSASGSCRYWRLHGAPRIYYSRYDDEALARFEAQVRSSPRAVPAWVIFDNTTHGHAIPNALGFKDRFA